jgi:hypothetical protein
MSIVKEKPVFSTIDSIRPGIHCYNVYCRVLKATHTTMTRLSGDVVKVCEGVVADHTACVDFHFEGPQTELLQTGATVAIRNGRSEVVKEHIRLEIDPFGKISKEDASLVKDTTTSENISEHAYIKKPVPAAREGKREPEGDRQDQERGDRRRRQTSRRAQSRRQDGGDRRDEKRDDRKDERREESRRRPEPRKEERRDDERKEGRREVKRDEERRDRRGASRRGPRRDEGQDEYRKVADREEPRKDTRRKPSYRRDNYEDEYRPIERRGDEQRDARGESDRRKDDNGRRREDSRRR